MNPLKLVRRAGAAITGGGVNEDEASMNFREKFSLQLKGTVSKDAETVAYYSIRSDSLMKRTDQGTWQKRFAALVPHTFLYLFDNEYAEGPHEVLDMDIYTNITTSDDNVLILSPKDDIPLRQYYFQLDDYQALDNWVNSIHNGRFAVLRDERDAYQQLQVGFGGQIEKINDDLEASKRNNEKIQYELLEAKKVNDDMLHALQRLIAVVSDGDENVFFDAGSCDSISSAILTLEKKVLGLSERVQKDKNKALDV